jgi:hypothetical protein
LALEFLKTGTEYAYQRAGAKLLRDGVDVLKALGAAKCAQEAAALDAGTA